MASFSVVSNIWAANAQANLSSTSVSLPVESRVKPRTLPLPPAFSTNTSAP